MKTFVFILLALRHVLGAMVFPFGASQSHSDTPHLSTTPSEPVISPTQRPSPDNTQHSQQTDIHVPSGIRTHNFSKQAAAEPHL